MPVHGQPRCPAGLGPRQGLRAHAVDDVAAGAGKRDYVIATGVQYSVRQFVDMAARELGITLAFEGEGVAETAVVKAVEGHKAPAVKVGSVIVSVDSRYFRPTEVETLLGNPLKAKTDLSWVPQITLREMVEEMVASDLDDAQRKRLLNTHGYSVAKGQG